MIIGDVSLFRRHTLELLVSFVLRFWLTIMVMTQWELLLDTNLTKWLSMCECSLQTVKKKELFTQRKKCKRKLRTQRN